MSSSDDGEQHARVDRKSLKRKGLAGIAWTVFGTAGQGVSQVVVLVILSRLLTPYDFGLASAASIIVGFGSIFTQLGVGPAIIQRPELGQDHIRTGFTLGCLSGFILGALFFLFAPQVAAYFKMPALMPIVEVMALIFPIQSVAIVSQSLLRRRLEFRALGFNQAISFTIGYAAVGIALAAAGYGAMSLAAAAVAQSIIQTGLLLVRSPHAFRPLLTRKAVADLSYYGGGHTLARIGNYFALQGDNLVVGKVLGASALGLYGRAYQVTALPATLFSKIVDQVLFPTLAAIQADNERLRAGFRRGSVVVALITLPVSVVAFIGAPEITGTLLGDKWLALVPCFRVLCLSMWFRTSYKMSDSLARSTGNVYRRAWRQLAYAVAVLGGAWIGARWGIVGVAFGVMVAITINFILMCELSLKMLNMTWKEFLLAHVPPLLLSALIGVVTLCVLQTSRGLGAPAYVSLAVTLMVVGLVSVIIVMQPRLSQVFIGADGGWLIMPLVDRLKATIRSK